MSMHRKPLTPLEEAGLRAHGLDMGTPSQLSDVFRHGIAWTLMQYNTKPLVTDRRLIEMIRGYITSHSDRDTLPDMSGEAHLLSIMHLALDEDHALRVGAVPSNQDVRAMVVMEFNGDEIPVFSQGLRNHEVLSVVTAERCTDLVAAMVTMRKEKAELLARVEQFERCIARVAHHVGAVCGGVDTEDQYGPGGHTAVALIDMFDGRPAGERNGDS